jgi:hypothetical protein
MEVWRSDEEDNDSFTNESLPAFWTEGCRQGFSQTVCEVLEELLHSGNHPAQGARQKIKKFIPLDSLSRRLRRAVGSRRCPSDGCTLFGKNIRRWGSGGYLQTIDACHVSIDEVVNGRFNQ